jgi:urease accessory protein
VTASGPQLLSLLQFGDSAFPTGGYAHSFGLESCCQSGVVRDAGTLGRFLVTQLEGSTGPCDASAAARALGAMQAGDRKECLRLDEIVEAMKPVREFREGSRQMGRQTLRVAAALTGDASLAAYLGQVGDGQAPGHHAVAFGMAGGLLGWTGLEAATAFLYSTSALLVGAALRLLPIGQLEGQRVLWGLHPVVERLAREAAAREAADLWSFTPGLDIEGMRHERLEARLFRS